MKIHHYFSYSQFRYVFPVHQNGKRLPTYSQLGYSSPAHTGRFTHAIDISVPDPRNEQLEIIAPQDGTIIALKQNGSLWGPHKTYNEHLNYVTVKVGPCEFYELCHIEQKSCPYKIGDKITKGGKIALTGLNGWTTLTNGLPDSHVHLLVAKVNVNISNFESVRIRFYR